MISLGIVNILDMKTDHGIDITIPLSERRWLH